MPRDLLPPGTGANATGQWTRVEPPGRKTWPFRVMFVSTPGGWTAGNVILEELTGGLPVSRGPLQGNPGDLVPGQQTGVVEQLGTFAAGAPDYTIEAPCEFVRARTDGGIVGTLAVRLIEAE